MWNDSRWKQSIWNYDFWLWTHVIFSTYRSEQISPSEIHTREVMILAGTLISPQQPPRNGPSPLRWPAKSPRVKIWQPVVKSLYPPVRQSDVLSQQWLTFDVQWDGIFLGQEAVSCRGGIRIIWTPGDWATFCRTWGTILNGGNAYRRTLPLSQGTDMASINSALRSGYTAMQTWWGVLSANVANKSTCGSPHLANTGRRCTMAIVHSVFSVWPTLQSVSE